MVTARQKDGSKFQIKRKQKWFAFIWTKKPTYESIPNILTEYFSFTSNFKIWLFN